MKSIIKAALAASLLLACSAYAQTYPIKPVRIIVGFGAGGGIDIVSRIYAQRLTESLNRLNSEIEKLQQTRELREQMANQGTDPARLSPSAFADLIRNDIGKWGKIVRDTGLKQD